MSERSQYCVNEVNFTITVVIHVRRMSIVLDKRKMAWVFFTSPPGGFFFAREGDGFVGGGGYCGRVAIAIGLL